MKERETYSASGLWHFWRIKREKWYDLSYCMCTHKADKYECWYPSCFIQFSFIISPYHMEWYNSCLLYVFWIILLNLIWQLLALIIEWTQLNSENPYLHIYYLGLFSCFLLAVSTFCFRFHINIFGPLVLLLLQDHRTI